jgi:hypothetical protein
MNLCSDIQKLKLAINLILNIFLGIINHCSGIQKLKLRKKSYIPYIFGHNKPLLRDTENFTLR